MLNFELSKLIDNIYKFGKCIVLIKLDNNETREIEIKINDDNELNVDDEFILSIISLLYFEAFLPKNFEKYRQYFIQKPKEIDSEEALVLINFLPLIINSFEIKVKNIESEQELENNNNIKLITIKICNLIEKMLINSKPLTDNLDISAFNIYRSTKEYLEKDDKLKEYNNIDIDILVSDYFDKYLIPQSVIEALRLRKSLLEAKHLGESARKSIEVISELFELVNNNNLNNTLIKEILIKYDYDNISEEFKKNIDDYLREIGYGEDNNYKKIK